MATDDNIPAPKIIFTLEEETWTDNRLQFRVRALGHAATGTVDVAEDHARLEVMLPWPLAQIADKIERAIQSQGQDHAGEEVAGPSRDAAGGRRPVPAVTICLVG